MLSKSPAQRLTERPQAAPPDYRLARGAAVGNIYRHEYDVVDNALVWHTI